MALRMCNSGTQSGNRELFKGSKDSPSLLVCTQKNSLLGECRFFVSDVIKPVVLKLFGSWATFVFQKPFAGHKN